MVVRGALESPSRLFQNRATPSQLADLGWSHQPAGSPPVTCTWDQQPDELIRASECRRRESNPLCANASRLQRGECHYSSSAYGRGGEDRTLVFGFGDQHPYHWTTPLLRDDGGIRTRVRGFADHCLNRTRLRHQSGRDTIRTCETVACRRISSAVPYQTRPPFQWSHSRESNPGPHPYQRCALPTELLRHTLRPCRHFENRSHRRRSDR